MGMTRLTSETAGTLVIGVVSANRAMGQVPSMQASVLPQVAQLTSQQATCASTLVRLSAETFAASSRAPPPGAAPLVLVVGNEFNACNEWRCSAPANRKSLYGAILLLGRY